MSAKDFKVAYIQSTASVNGGTSYLIRILQERVKTNADVILFLFPYADKEELIKIKASIAKQVELYRKSLKPLVMPFAVFVRGTETCKVINANKTAFEQQVVEQAVEAGLLS